MAGFTFYFGSEKQASHYENTALFVINHTKKDFDGGNNIAEALRKLEYKNTDNWNPILKASTSSYEDVKGREDRQFELKFKAEFGECQKLKVLYQEYQYKAYGLIWERCATDMKAKIVARKDFGYSIYTNNQDTKYW